MLLLLRSDFRRPTQRTALLDLLTRARIDVADLLELRALDAPTSTALALRLRKTRPEKGSVLVIGSIVNESVEMAVDTVEDLRMLRPDLAALPTILVARQSEWQSYGQVAKAPAEIEFFEMNLSRRQMLVLPQSEQYGERQYFAVMAQTIADALGSASVASTRGNGREDTGVMYLDERPTGQLKTVTDSMLAEAGIKVEDSAPGINREDEPTGEIPLDDEDRTTELPPPPDFKSK